MYLQQPAQGVTTERHSSGKCRFVQLTNPWQHSTDAATRDAITNGETTDLISDAHGSGTVFAFSIKHRRTLVLFLLLSACRPERRGTDGNIRFWTVIMFVLNYAHNLDFFFRCQTYDSEDLSAKFSMHITRCCSLCQDCSSRQSMGRRNNRWRGGGRTASPTSSRVHP